MAKPRPPTLDFITADHDVIGVLVCRMCDGSQTREMVLRALVEDARWDRESAEIILGKAQVTVGFWYKVPQRDDDDPRAWLLVPARPGHRAGATPGIYYRWKD